MNLETLFFVTQSIFAIAATIFFVAIILLVYFLYKSFKTLVLKAEKAINESYDAAHEAKNYSSKIGRAILDYLVVRIFKNIKR